MSSGKWKENIIIRNRKSNNEDGIQKSICLVHLSADVIVQTEILMGISLPEEEIEFTCQSHNLLSKYKAYDRQMILHPPFGRARASGSSSGFAIGGIRSIVA